MPAADGIEGSLREVRGKRFDAVLSGKWAMPEDGPPRGTLRAAARLKRLDDAIGRGLC